MDNSASRAHVANVMSMVERSGVAPGADDWLLASWHRSVERYQLDPGRNASRRVLDGAAVRALGERMGLLLDVAKPHLNALERSVAVANYCVLLTDATGSTIYYQNHNDADGHFRRAGVRVGICWSEQEEGTCGIGTAIVDRKPVLVHKDEHFRADNIPLSCSAAPLFGQHDELLGVLDASTLYSPYKRDSQALVFGMVNERALLIENAYIERCLQDHWRLALSSWTGPCPPDADLLLAFDDRGHVLGGNRPARVQLLGQRAGPLEARIPGQAAAEHTLESLFDISAEELLRRSSAAPGLAIPLRVLATGVRLFGILRAPLGGAVQFSRPAPAPLLACDGFSRLAIGDPVLRDNVQRARKVVDHDIPVMLLGETGTGKEAFARALHDSSLRHSKPFVALNCAAIPESLIESELFGYRDGAFTGARARGSRGKIMQADGGTLFLDEIGDMPLLLQSRLLRVLAEGEVLPLGAEEASQVNLRVICATHQDLADLIRAGRFREDLYYRLSGAVFRLPPVRERSDVDALVEALRREEAIAGGRRGWQIAPDALAALRGYAWPGNVRQLRHALRYALAIGESSPLPLDAFPADIVAACRARVPVAPALSGATLSAMTQDAPADTPPDATLPERMLWALRRHKWHVSAAAKALGMPRASFYRKMAAYRIVPPNDA